MLGVKSSSRFGLRHWWWNQEPHLLYFPCSCVWHFVSSSDKRCQGSSVSKQYIKKKLTIPGSGVPETSGAVPESSGTGRSVQVSGCLTPRASESPLYVVIRTQTRISKAAILLLPGSYADVLVLLRPRRQIAPRCGEETMARESKDVKESPIMDSREEKEARSKKKGSDNGEEENDGVSGEWED